MTLLVGVSTPTAALADEPPVGLAWLDEVGDFEFVIKTARLDGTQRVVTTEEGALEAIAADGEHILVRRTVDPGGTNRGVLVTMTQAGS